MRIVLLAAAVVAAAGAAAAGYALGSSKDAETVTATTTVREPGLPAAVERTRAKLLAAAETGDYERLRPLVPKRDFSYTFGIPPKGGPIAYWKNVEQTNEDTPIAILAAILKLPYTLRQGLYVWPFAYGLPKSEATPYERRLLGDFFRSYAGQDYYGWRAGIAPDGRWLFFVAGD